MASEGGAPAAMAPNRKGDTGGGTTTAGRGAALGGGTTVRVTARGATCPVQVALQWPKWPQAKRRRLPRLR
jgi:hypothetical protein